MKYVLAALAMLIAAPALAIDFSVELKSFDGKSFTDQAGHEAPQILGTLVENTLLALPGDGADEKAKADDRAKSFWLAMRIHNHPDTALSIDEMARVKRAISTLPTALMGQALRVIDPASVPKDVQ